MHQDSFGSLLADARRQCNYTVEDVANSLCIRPDIILTIERCDLHSLPPRAYTRNMISRYARFVRLNSEYILNLYDEISYTTEISDIRSSGNTSQRTGQFGAVSTRRQDIVHDNGTNVRYNIDSVNQDNEFSSSTESTSALKMPSSRMSSAYSLPNDQWQNLSGNEYTNNLSGRRNISFEDDFDRLNRQARSSSRNKTQSNSYGADNDATSRRQAGRTSRTHYSTRSALPDAHPTNLYASRATSSSSKSRSKFPLPVVIIGVIIVVVIVAVVFAVVGGKSSSSAKTNTAPISGLTDTASSAEESAKSLAMPIAPTSVEFAYSVNSGVESYIEIYLDDNSVATLAQVVSGPAKGSYTITGKLKFVCTQPDGVNLTVDGQAVKLTSNEDVSWLYEYKIDFAEYLAKWQEEHAAEIAAAQKAKEELLAAQEAEKNSAGSSSGSTSNSSSSGKTTTSN